jgi:cytochrome b561
MRQSREKYPLEIRVLHWLMAIAIIGMLIAGFVVSGIPKDDPTRHLVLGLHKSFGISLFALAALRLLSRLFTTVPSLPEVIPSMQRAIVQAAHVVVYALMLLMPLSGYVMSISMGQPVRWFGLAVPRLLAEDRARGLMAGNVHGAAAYVLIALLVLHIGAVAWHYVVDRVNLLRRMV